MPRRHGDLEVANAIALSLGRRLRHLRQRAGWTQSHLSGLVSLTPEAYARLERGRSMPSLPTLLRLANVLQVTSDALLSDAQAQLRGPTATAQEDDGLALDLAILAPGARESIRALVRQLTARAA